MVHCDPRLCVGCRRCEVACADFHFGAVSPILSRIRVAKLEEIGIDMSVACVSCVEKSCLICPRDALSAGENGTIVLEADQCDGCEVCFDACPIGAVGFHDDLPLFCDLCDGELSCVIACPSGALSSREESDTSLRTYEHSKGSSGQRRAVYARAESEDLRTEWLGGRRVDS
ncbi:4Fe-4S dicluster domain-containing protein [Candidatus Zixiibacteriota bacterium]